MTYVIIARLDDTETGPFDVVARGVSYPMALAIIEFLAKQNIQCYKGTISERHAWLLLHQQELMDRFNFTQPQED